MKQWAIFALALSLITMGGTNSYAVNANKLKVEAQAGYIAGKECQRRVGGFEKRLKQLKQRRDAAKKKFPPLLSEGSRSLVRFYARSVYNQFESVPKRQWKEYCRLGLGKSLIRSRTLK